MTTATSPLPLRTEIVFIESNVADYATLIAGLDPALEVHLLDATGDGLAQMAEILAGRSGIDAIHLISHGSAGAVQLGTVTLDEATLQSRQADLETIGKSLSETGDLLLYGCNVAQGQAGIDFIGKLAQATGADVAASDDLTGAPGKGGDWVLEYAENIGSTSLGALEKLAGYGAQLALPVGEQTYNNFEDPNFTDTGPTLVNAYFVISGSTSGNPGNGQLNAFALIAYLSGANDGDGTTENVIRIAADNVDVKSFELTQINLSDYVGTIEYSVQNLQIVGHKADNSGTVSTGTIPAGTTGDDEFTHLNIPTWSVFSGVQLDYFEIRWSHLVGNLVNGGTAASTSDCLELVSFSVNNLTAPSLNAVPTIALDNASHSYTENASAIQVDATGTVSDADGNADWNGGKLDVQITSGAIVSDEISISDTDADGTAITVSGTNILANGTDVGDLSVSGGVVTGGTKLTITFDSDATNAIVQETLQSLRYRNTGDAPGDTSRVVTVTATDKNAASATDTRTIASTPVNDDPVVTAGGTTAFTEQTETAVAPAITITDVDGDADWNGGTLKVQITGNASADDSLRLPTTNPGTGIWVDGIGTNNLYSGATLIGTASASTVTSGSAWTFTFNASATNALVQDVARAVQFGNDSNDPSTASRTVTFTATDNGGLSNLATQTVQVTSVNDAPVVTNRNDPGLVFSGVNTSYASFPDIDNSVTESFTLETWVKFSSLSDAYAVQFIAGKGASGVGNVEQMELHTNGNALRFIPTGGAYIDTGNVLTTNQWIHIAASYDAATDASHIYINGVEVSVQDNHPAGNPDDALKSTNHPYYLGMRGDGSYPLNGSIAEFRIWNDIRTADEVRNNMNVGLEGNEANLVALWKLDEDSGTALDDATTNNFDGTANNASWTTRPVTGGLAVNYTEGAAPVSLFSGATVSTVESGQGIIGLTLTVTHVSDTTERLAIDGSTIDLVHGTSEPRRPTACLTTSPSPPVRPRSA